MRQLPLIGLLVLLPASAVSAAHFHVRHTTYACVDPKATLSPNDPALRAQGRCFAVYPREHLEQIWRPSRRLRLMRVKPPHVGQPPLYFRASSVTAVSWHRGHHHWRRPHRVFQSSTATFTPPIETPAPASALLLPPAMQARQAPAVTAPALTVPAVSTPPGARSAPATAPAKLPAAAALTAIAPVHEPAQPRENPGRFHHIFATLLLWALIAAGAVLLVRVALFRKQRPLQAAPAQLSTATLQIQEPIWTPHSIWHETRVEPVVERVPVGEPMPAASTPATPPAGTVGYASGYRMAPLAPSPAADLSDYKNRCVAGLRDAGWDARTRFSAGLPGPDVIARSGGLVLALRCLPSSQPVDVEAVEDACQVRDRQRSDLAAIVSNADFTEAARQLAARNGIVLLHENELSSFAA